VLIFEDFYVDKVNFAFFAEVGKLWCWVTLLFLAFCMANRCGPQRQDGFQANRTKGNKSSKGQQADSCKNYQHINVLVSNNERGKESGSPEQKGIFKGGSRCSGFAAGDKHLQPPNAHADRSIAQKRSITLAIQIGDQRKAERLLKELFDAGVVPDVRLCNLVINSYARNGDVACAENWFMTMRSMGLTPNKASYNMILDVCVKADNVEAAERWFLRLIDDGQTPDEVSYATMIYAHAKHGATEQAEKWLQHMLKTGVQPNVVTYNSLIVACARNGDIVGAEKWAYAAENLDLSARASDHAASVDARAKCDDDGKQVKKMCSLKVEPNVVTYSSIIGACAKAGDRIRAEWWHKRMLERGLQPNGHTFSSVITACAKAGDVVAASRYLDDMQRAQIPADRVVYGSILNACAKASDAERAKKMFEQMQSSGIQPNAFHYAALAQSLAHTGNWVEVENLQRTMINSGIPLDEHFLYALLLAYSRNRTRQPQRAEAAFLDARAKGVRANKHVLTCLRKAVGMVRYKELMAAGDVLPQQMTQTPKWASSSGCKACQSGAKQKPVQD